MLLVERGLASSRTLAQALVMEGRVSAAGRRVDKPGTRVDAGCDVAVAGDPRRFASRGGLKLEAALEAFALDVTGLVALDVGASTGGFTDCLLKRGAARVYAVDVGHGQIDHALRTDPRVTVVERVNARHLSPAQLPGAVDIVVMDVSFISATMILPALPPLMRGVDAVVLVKPQFEVGRAGVGKRGIVKSREHWRAAILGVAEGARGAAFGARGVIPSPITGAGGNCEFLLHLVLARDGAIPPVEALEPAIASAVAAAGGGDAP